MRAAAIAVGGITLPLAAVMATMYTCGPPGTVPVTVSNTRESFRFEIEGRRVHQFGSQVFLPPGNYKLTAVSSARKVTDEVTIGDGELYLTVRDDGKISLHN